MNLKYFSFLACLSFCFKGYASDASVKNIDRGHESALNVEQKAEIETLKAQLKSARRKEMDARQKEMDAKNLLTDIRSAATQLSAHLGNALNTMQNPEDIAKSGDADADADADAGEKKSDDARSAQLKEAGRPKTEAQAKAAEKNAEKFADVININDLFGYEDDAFEDTAVELDSQKTQGNDDESEASKVSRNKKTLLHPQIKGGVPTLAPKPEAKRHDSLFASIAKASKERRAEAGAKAKAEVDKKVASLLKKTEAGAPRTFLENPLRTPETKATPKAQKKKPFHEKKNTNTRDILEKIL